MHFDDDDIRQEISLWAVRRGLPDPVNVYRSARLRRRFMAAASRKVRERAHIEGIPAEKLAGMAPTPVLQAIAAERREILIGAVKRLLSGVCRDVMLLVVDGQSIPAVAAQTMLQPRQIYNHINYGKRVLREDAVIRSLRN